MLFGVEPLDSMTFVAVASVLMLAALLATVAPAWKATRADPALTLRAE
jgi:putative ABC transport system permease protein